jgi:hypothetical protein
MTNVVDLHPPISETDLDLILKDYSGDSIYATKEERAERYKRLSADCEVRRKRESFRIV